MKKTKYKLLFYLMKSDDAHEPYFRMVETNLIKEVSNNHHEDIISFLKDIQVAISNQGDKKHHYLGLNRRVNNLLEEVRRF